MFASFCKLPIELQIEVVCQSSRVSDSIRLLSASGTLWRADAAWMKLLQSVYADGVLPPMQGARQALLQRLRQGGLAHAAPHASIHSVSSYNAHYVCTVDAFRMLGPRVVALRHRCVGDMSQGSLQSAVYSVLQGPSGPLPLIAVKLLADMRVSSGWLFFLATQDVVDAEGFFQFRYGSSGYSFTDVPCGDVGVREIGLRRYTATCAIARLASSPAVSLLACGSVLVEHAGANAQQFRCTCTGPNKRDVAIPAVPFGPNHFIFGMVLVAGHSSSIRLKGNEICNYRIDSNGNLITSSGISHNIVEFLQ